MSKRNRVTSDIVNDPERIKASYATESSLAVPVPKGKKYLPYQVAGIEFAVYTPYIHVLIADEPGLGKTVQAIGIMNFRPGTPILIVCPASLMTNWKRHIEDWSVNKLTIQLIQSGRDELRDCDCYIISFNLTTNKILFDKLFKKGFYYIIFDEVHYLKTSTSQRTNSCLGSKKKEGLLSVSKYGISLTGTPAPNRPIELYTLITAFCPEALSKNGVVMSEETYGFKYCGGRYDERGRPDFRGASNLKDLGRRLRSTFMIRRKKIDVLKDLPEKRSVITYLNMDKDCEELVEAMKEFKVSSLSKGAIPVSYEGLSEMRRELGEKKAPIAAEYIRTRLESHKKIIVFAHHKDVITILEEELSEYGVLKIIGATPKNKRQGIVDQFHEDESKRIFLASGAAREGLTIIASSYVIFVEFDWVPGNNEQSIDRAHRIGQKKSVLADFLVFENSLDEKILKSHMSKASNINKMMNVGDKT